MAIYVAYNKRSFSTAKGIRDSLKQRGKNARIINDKRFKVKPTVFIRWGNSYRDTPEGVIEINSKEAVERASNKLLMANTLIGAEGVNFPPAECSYESVEVLSRAGLDVHIPIALEDNVDAYYRNSAGKVVRRRSLQAGDLYRTSPIDRAREFRVHVFNGRTMGVYEKVPHAENQDYCKNDNCDFKRIDMAVDANRNALRGVRPMAVAAVEAMGLLFGGVDVIIARDGSIYVNEVNSAPSLNGPNLERFTELVDEYVKEKQSNE